MRKIPRAVVASARALLESTFNLLAASGFAVHESGNRLAAQCTTTFGFTSSNTCSISFRSKMSSLMTSGGLIRLRPVPMDFQPSRKNCRCTCRPRRPLASLHGQPESWSEIGMSSPPVTSTVCVILLVLTKDKSLSYCPRLQCSERGQRASLERVGVLQAPECGDKQTNQIDPSST